MRHGRRCAGRSLLVVLILSCLAACIAGCAGSRPVQVQLQPGARIGVLNLVEPWMTHIQMGALRFNSFTNTYPVDWDLAGHLTRRIEANLTPRGTFTFVPIAVDADPGWAQSMSAAIQSTVTTWMSGDLRRFLQQTAVENRLDLIVTVSSYGTGTRPPDSCFRIFKTDLPTQGYGVFTRSITLPVQIDAEAIEARYESGVLTLSLPKAEEVRPKRIAVQNVATPQMVEGKTADIAHKN